MAKYWWSRVLVKIYKEILKCKADRTALKRYILLSPIFRIDNTILHQGHKMLSELHPELLSGFILGNSEFKSLAILCT